MLNQKEYIITNTLTSIGEISDSAKHRIGRKGIFLVLEKNKGFKFKYTGLDSCLTSSTVCDINQLEDGTLRVLTLNTTYEFKTV